MNQKFTFKSIKAGQTQKINLVTSGAGISGNALVLSAVDGSRYQLADVVTLVSPPKLQLKRQGADLHLALPGGDLDVPDVVIKGYFDAKGVSLWGTSVGGEALSYNTQALATSYSAAPTPSEQAGAAGDTPEGQSIAEMSTATLTAPLGETLLSSTFSNPWMLAGGLGLAAVGLGGGGGGGGSSSSSSNLKGLDLLKAYAAATNGSGVTAPTLSTYKDAGVKALANLSESTASLDVDDSRVTTALGITSAAWLSTLNTALDKLDAAALTTAKLQAMVDSYYRILSEADGVVNTTTNNDVYPTVNGTGQGKDDPDTSDYTNIGATVGNAKSVDLLNDFVGLSAKTAVDTVDEINVVAKAAYNVMIQAGVASASTAPALYTTDAEWVAGLTTLLGLSGLTTGSITAIKDKIKSTATLGTANDGAEVDTVQELKDLLTPVIALQTLKDYANAVNGSGVTAPTLSTYKDAGVKALASLNENTASGDIDGNGVTVVLGISTDAWLKTLNSGLDKLTTANTSSDFAGDVQKMVNSYYRILSEADGTASNIDVYPTVNDTGQGKDDPDTSDYANIGATVGNAKSVDLLNDFVGLSAKTAVDTVDEINVVAKAAYNVMVQAGMTTAPTGIAPALYATDAEWVAGLTALGVSGVNTGNITAIKDKIKSTATLGTANDGAEVDTVQELKDLLAPVIALKTLKDYANANSGSGGVTVPTLTTYKDAGIKALANLSETNASADIDGSGVTGALGIGSDAWVKTLNNALDKLTTANTSTDFASDVQKMVNSYYRILSEADGVVNTKTNTPVNGGGLNTNNDPIASDYTNIGATVGSTLKSLDLLNDFVGLSAKAAVDTMTEVDAAARAAENIMLKAKGATTAASGGPVIYTTNADWVSGLGALGISGVDASNIAAVQKAIDDSTVDTTGDGTAVNTVAKVQALVSWVRLKAYTDDTGLFSGTPVKTAATPTLTDWNAIGVKGRTSLSDAAATQDLSASNTNLSALNSALDRWASATDLASVSAAQTTLQKVADSYARVLGEADGNRAVDVNVYSSSGTDSNDPAQSDFENILGGSTNLTTLTSGADGSWLALLNDCIGGLSTSAVDTATEVEDLTKTSVNVMKQAVGSGWSYTNDSDWVTALSGLGIVGLSGMSSANLATVKTNITNITAGDQIDTWAELQSIVSLVRINDYATLNTNATPSFSDYQAFFTYGTAGKTDIVNNGAYLNAFNDAVNYKPSNAFTAAEVKSMVDGYAAILAEANGSASDQQSYDPLASDYLAVGVGSGSDYQVAIRSMLGDANNNGMLDGSEASTSFANLLSDVVANKNQTDVDTVKELNDLALIVTKIRDLVNKPAGNTTYTDITGGSLQVSELTSFGLDTSNLTDSNFTAAVRNNRLTNVYDSIIAATDPTTVDSLSELQTLINNTNVIKA